MSKSLGIYVGCTLMAAMSFSCAPADIPADAAAPPQHDSDLEKELPPPAAREDEEGGPPTDTPNHPAPTSPYCRPDANGQYPDTLRIETSTQNDVVKAVGGGCIHRSIEDTWLTMKSAAPMTWEGVSGVTIRKRTDHPADITDFFQVDYYVKHLVITVEWTMHFLHSFEGGNLAHPSRVWIRYKKIAGTGYIKFWEGSVVLDYLSPTVTAFVMSDRINAAQTGEKEGRESIEIMADKLRHPH